MRAEGGESSLPALTEAVKRLTDDGKKSAFEARGKKFVTVVSDDGTKEEVPVEIGISDGTKQEIIKGLTVGQTVVDFKGQSDSKWSGQKSGGPPKMGMIPGGGPRKG